MDPDYYEQLSKAELREQFLSDASFDDYLAQYIDDRVRDGSLISGDDGEYYETL